jgi:hypothetical protein
MRGNRTREQSMIKVVVEVMEVVERESLARPEETPIQ